MKIGDYVRTKEGKIGIVLELSYNIHGTIKYLIKWSNCKAYYVSRIKDYKSSPNIIDLIEVGDYVNGERVINIIKEHKYLEVSDEEIIIDEKDIKSIVTKEQFEAMKYEL